MEILAYTIFYTVAGVGGFFFLVSFVAMIFGCDTFGQAVGVTLFLLALAAVLYGANWSWDYLQLHHLWPFT